MTSRTRNSPADADDAASRARAPGRNSSRWWALATADDPAAGGVRPGVAAAILAGMHVLLALLVFNPMPHTGGDNAAYLALSRSLLQGRYVELWDPAIPVHTQYPPLFPAILAAGRLVGMHSWVPFKLIVVAFSGLGVAFSYLWTRRWGSAGAALAVGLVLCFSPGVLDLGNWVLSDVPFWAFFILALWAWAAVAEAGADRLGPWLWIAVAGTLLAYFTRSAGLPLVVAAAAWLAWRRRWKSLAALLVVVGVPALLWWLRSRGGADVGYGQQFLLVDPYDPSQGTIGLDALRTRIGQNATNYVRVHLPILLFGKPGPWLVLLGLFTLGLGALGWAARIRRPGIAEIALPLYLGLLLIWPAVWSGERFLLPALPLILGFAAVGLGIASRSLAPGAMKGVAVLATLLLITAGAPQLRAEAAHGFECRTLASTGDAFACLPKPNADFYRMAEWARTATLPDAVFLTRKPTLFYHYADRRSRIYPKSRNPQDFFDAVRETGARYLVVDRIGDLTLYYAGAAVQAYPQAFCLAHADASSSAAVLGILPVAERLPDAVAPAKGPPASVRFEPCPIEYRSAGSGATPQ